MSDPIITPLKVTGISKTYSRGFRRSPVRALDDLSLSVARGEIFGLLGPNGAGKTTLVKILLGLVKPDTGEAFVLGGRVGRAASRNRIGYLPENHRFPDFLTGAQMLHAYGKLANVSETDRRARIPELLDLVSMTAWADTRIKQYSKGMMQRVGVAQALINDPDVVFLDEPTDGVDPVGRKDIRDILLGLRSAGKTVFINSHLLSEIEQVCTRVAIMSNGRLVREGSVASLTQATPGYELTTSAVPNDVAVRFSLKRLRDPHPGLEAYSALSADRHDLNEIVDGLRAHGVLIEAVRPLRLSLEDYFIEVVGKGATP